MKMANMALCHACSHAENEASFTHIACSRQTFDMHTAATGVACALPVTRDRQAFNFPLPGSGIMSHLALSVTSPLTRTSTLHFAFCHCVLTDTHACACSCGMRQEQAGVLGLSPLPSNNPTFPPGSVAASVWRRQNSPLGHGRFVFCVMPHHHIIKTWHTCLLSVVGHTLHCLFCCERWLTYDHWCV